LSGAFFIYELKTKTLVQTVFNSLKMNLLCRNRQLEGQEDSRIYQHNVDNYYQGLYFLLTTGPYLADINKKGHRWSGTLIF
jgi:hypothetical protein